MTYARSIEPEPSVTITDQAFFGHGWQPLTITILQATWFMPQGAEFSVEDLVDWFRSLGWKSANGKPLGPDAVRRELALIRQAGYIHAHRTRGDRGRVTGIRYEISKRARPQREDVIRFDEDKAETRRSHHVPPSTTHGGAPELADQAEQQVASHASIGHTRPTADVAEHGKPQVAPCASDGAHPPHPPEGVVTPSPYPLAAAPSATSDGSGNAADSDNQVQAAYDFLQDLPNPWRAGRATARKLAPQLAEAAAEQGWELDDALAKKLTETPEGIKRYPSVLARRIEDLPRRGRQPTPAQQRERYSDVPDRPANVGYADDAVNAAKIAAARAALRELTGTG
ncbi:hypothetical protein [Streptomyces sp. NPDC059881]|uniref:hypothetical protein n=1 Tax=Streptomyces sp. NPDC059881 TaxID=3346986 RepID=UPI003659D7C4